MRGEFTQVVIILLTALICFCGVSLRAGAVYFLLRVAMSGLVGENGRLEHIFWAIVLWSVWLYSVHTSRRKIVPIELRLGAHTAKIKGLIDTGNSLVDPITGKQVLVIGADVVCKLTGLTRQQLIRPVENIGAIPGLRLIPYKTVGQSGGLLLAIQIPESRIGNWRGSTLVAFAPQVLDESGKYQALIGGRV